jgi:prepilin-type N-terminal cleavage/methylation domain-containing protein
MINQKSKIKNQKLRTMRKFYGFTLLELLVVISILAILISISIASYATAQKKARDSRRKGDAKEIQAALEQYYSICGNVYPTIGSPGGTLPSAINCPNPPISIMPNVPKDPRGADYICSSCTATSYMICPSLEAESTTFCVYNQQ